ncbi:AAA ATPase [Tulasnella sp. 332]|nr:AAA ATPase [Tulasnella sp. 332]
MILGKRNRNSLASSTSSTATTVASISSSVKSTASTPASSVAGSPAPPSLKRARTRSSTCLSVEEVYEGKENILPENWFVCGRDADGNSSFGGEVDDDDGAEEGEGNSTEPEATTEGESPTRQTRSRARVANGKLHFSVNCDLDYLPDLVITSFQLVTPTRPSPRLLRTRSMPTNAFAAPETPPPTPPRRRAKLTHAQTSTPSTRLSKLTLKVDDETLATCDDTRNPSPTSSTSSKEKSIYAQARTLLRGGTTSSLNNASSRIVITARDKERRTIEEYLLCGGFLSPKDAMDVDPSGNIISSLYISGSPGTGKTALVTDILQKLQDRKDLRSYTVVYVNCMGLSDVKTVWERVWEALLQTWGGCASGKLKAGDAKKYFEDALKRDQGLRCILILDEIDFISRTPAALSEVYSVARKYPSTLRMIGISNTLTLGSEAASTPATPTKVPRSSSTSTIIGYTGPEKSLNFTAYTAEDLLSIITTRLSALQPADRDAMFMPVALNFLCKKVAALNGDVRFALSVLRRCIDTVDREINSPVVTLSTPKRGGRVEMKHVLESLRAHENGSSASSASSTADDTSAKGSGVSRTVRGLGLHARLAIVALLVGWKRVEAGLALAAQTPGGSASSSVNKITSTTLYAFYVALLTTDIVDSRGDMTSASSFSPVTRSEFQDILGVLETSGLVTFTQTAPIFAASKLSSSSSLPSFATAPVTTPPKTPTRPRGSGRSTSLRNFSLPTPPSMSGGGGAGRRKASSANEPFMVLSEGVREDEVVRGLISSTIGISSEKKAGLVEREIESLWERECKRVRKEVERRDRKKVEDEEKRRMDDLAFEK